ncbi:hypothetical protein GE09DRAFT_1187960 [Coniochaeta sp. 2T2.1]|nr:hypothetical protein GE09DRAFT_1187960 [Coniochaeta sp. 2T2.1]
MANPVPYNHHQLPVTPPADNDGFKGLFSPQTPHKPEQPLNMFSLMNAMNTTLHGQSQRPKSEPQPQNITPPLQTTPPPSQTDRLPQNPPRTPPSDSSSQHQQPFPFPSSIPIPPGPVPHLHDPAGNPIDPRYVAMASRISAYYQQRCQAVANYQQQRCQQWAALQRQKCQDMMQAAMLVVAWYIRDRIQRRRRKEKRRFRKGLSRKMTGTTTQGRPTKGETVRRWVMDVPDDVLSAGKAEHEALRDKEEREWDMDKAGEEGAGSSSRDDKLFRTADDLIRSQVGKIEVPLMGVVGFEESESESESDSEVDYEDDEEMDYEDDEEEEEEYEEDEVVDEGKKGVERMGSQEVQVSSGKNSRKRTRSSCDS